MGEEEDRRNPKSKDPANKEFWDRVHGSFAIALEMLKESAARFGIDINELEIDVDAEKSAHEQAEKHPLVKSAKEYARAADDWFEKNESAFQTKQEELEKLERMDLPSTNPLGEALDISDAVDIIRWYQHLIGAKTYRAVSGRDDRDELAEEFDFPKDSDGSAKVALISIDRSIAAWSGLLQHFPEYEESVLPLLVHLERLRRAVEHEFPDARRFQRPGFDYMPD